MSHSKEESEDRVKFSGAILQSFSVPGYPVNDSPNCCNRGQYGHSLSTISHNCTQYQNREKHYINWSERSACAALGLQA